jgi:16S rRNA (cytosine967-C5)-methyltransferase
LFFFCFSTTYYHLKLPVNRAKQPTARVAAADILIALFNSRKPVNSIFDRLVKEYELPARDRSLTMTLVYGVLRNRQYLERILELLSKTSQKKMDPFVRQSILVGLYQIFFLDRIPESAAVNEAVNGCKIKKTPKRLHGFVNGILRESIRQKGSLQETASRDKQGKMLSNHPPWMVERWQKQFGLKRTEAICTTNNHEPSLVLRVNTSAIEKKEYCTILEQEGILFSQGRYAEDALVLANFTGSPAGIPGYEEGYFAVQDEAAQLATSLLAPFKKNGKYLDGCAGLGGKTTHLLSLGKEYNLHVQAVEPEQFRLNKLAENIKRLFQNREIAYSCHKGSLQDLSHENLPLFDGILIDAPCSGTGVIGRHPDIRWNRRIEDLVKYQKVQLELLSHAAKLLIPGGILVYATCSLEPEENIEVVESFLQKQKNINLTNCSDFLPLPAHPLVRDGFFTPLPAESIDGFFAARFQIHEED